MEMDADASLVPPQQKTERWMTKLTLVEPTAHAKCLENLRAD